MDKNNNIFQIVVLGIFVALAIISVIVFSTVRARQSGNTLTPVTMWGTIPQPAMEAVFDTLRETMPDLNKVTYVAFDPSDYYDRLVEALASGTGPDLMLIDQDMLITHLNKLAVIPYTTLSAREYRDTFIDGGELFMFGDGIYGLPYTVDPIVMYWNRDMFASASLTIPPKYWDELYTIVPKLTVLTQDGKVKKSAVALGTYTNINDAKGILSTLFLQVGCPIVEWSATKLSAGFLTNSYNLSENPAQAALRFYTQFSNPVNSLYSWHQSLPNSLDAFLAGDLAIYFGYASEAPKIRSANPNLNYDIATVPQSRVVPRRTTYGRFQAFAIPRSSRVLQRAYSVARVLTSAQAMAVSAQKLGFPATRRDLLAQPSSSSYWSVANDSAIISKSWLEPNKKSMDQIFAEMVESVLSGKGNVTTVIGVAQTELSYLLR